jgi:mitochondrial import inner membrane translocase subunit TIM8
MADNAQMQQFLEVRRRRSRTDDDDVVDDARTRPAARVPHRTDPFFRLSLLAQEEKRKAVFNEVVAKLTDTCFEKCITYAPGSSFSRTESSCLTNCALRYLESGQVVLGRLQNMGGG